MNIELRFNEDDLETKSWVMKEFNCSEDDFMEIRSFEGTTIVIAVLIAIEALIKNPGIIDIFLKREGCEVEFDEHGNLLRAKGYTPREIIEMQTNIIKNKTEDI